MPLNISLEIGTERYDVLQCQYGFGRVVTPLGWPGRGVNGGDIILVMESTKSNTLFEEFTRKRVTPISGSIEIYEVDEKIVVRTIAFEEAFLYSIGENMQKDSSLPMTMTIAISPLRLDFDHKIRLDRRWPQTQGFWWEEHKREEEPIVFVSEKPKVYVAEVDGPSHGLPNEALTYKVIKYKNFPEESDRQNVKWQVKIGDKIENIPNRGETIMLKLKEDWAGEEITVMAYLYSPDEEVSQKTKVKLEAVIVFVNGYWNSGDSDVVAAPNTPQVGQVLTYKVLKKFIAQEIIGTVSGIGYWEDLFIENAKIFFKKKYMRWTQKSIDNIHTMYVDGAHVWYSTGDMRFNAGWDDVESSFRTQLLNANVINAQGEQHKRIVFVSHSMGAAHAEGMIAALAYYGIKPEMVLHFSAADNRDFQIKFPHCTWQIDLLPDVVLSYKNMDDKILNAWDAIWDYLNRPYMLQPNIYKINGIKPENFIATINLNIMNHAYTKWKEVWSLVPFLQK